MNQNDGIDFDALKGVLGYEKAASLWSKAEIAKILMKRASEIMEEIKTEIEFYSVVHGIEEE
jgi:hypothetical protein